MTHDTSSPSDTQPTQEHTERSDWRSDERGIALQTIIIMVVLLAIAATIAGVLLTRAGEETARLEDQDVATITDYSVFKSETACRLAANGQGLEFESKTAWAVTGDEGKVGWIGTAGSQICERKP